MLKSEARQALISLLNLDIKGHTLAHRLQFSAEGRDILDAATAAIASPGVISVKEACSIVGTLSETGKIAGVSKGSMWKTVKAGAIIIDGKLYVPANRAGDWGKLQEMVNEQEAGKTKP